MNSITHKTGRGRSWPWELVTCEPGTDAFTSGRTTTHTSDALLTQPKQPLNTGPARVLDPRQKLQIKLLRQQLWCQVFITEPHLPDQSQATQHRHADACCYKQIAVSVFTLLINSKLHPNLSPPGGPSLALSCPAHSRGVCRGTARQQELPAHLKICCRAANSTGQTGTGRSR